MCNYDCTCICCGETTLVKHFYRVSYEYYFCEYDFTQHKLKNTCVDSEIIVNHGSHLWIVLCWLAMKFPKKLTHSCGYVF